MSAIRKAALVSAVCFALSMIIYAAASVILGTVMSPRDVLLIALMFVIIGVLNYGRILISRTRWGMSKPLFIRNIIAAPFYFIIGLGFATLILGFWSFGTVLLLGSIFLPVFIVIQTVMYFRAKAKTDEMNEALSVFRKEHWGDEQE